MRIADMDWRMIEDWTRSDDRGVLPLGSAEQHSGLSLLTDSILAERVAVEAAEPLGVPVYPAIPFGVAPYFQAYPGSITLRVSTYAELIRDVLDSMKRSGFRRILVVNGHGGNLSAASRAAKTGAAVQATDPQGSHGNWMENFPWTRLPTTPADDHKDMIDISHFKTLPPFEARQMLEDGSFGGRSQRPDAEMLAIWQVAVTETRELLENW